MHWRASTSQTRTELGLSIYRRCVATGLGGCVGTSRQPTSWRDLFDSTFIKLASSGARGGRRDVQAIGSPRAAETQVARGRGREGRPGAAATGGNGRMSPKPRRSCESSIQEVARTKAMTRAVGRWMAERGTSCIRPEVTADTAPVRAILSQRSLNRGLSVI